MIIFLKSEWLFLFIVFPLFFLLKRFKILKSFKLYLNLLKWGEIREEKKHYFFSFMIFLYKLLIFLSVSFLIVSIAEPVVYKTKKSYYARGNSIMFVLDISPSMAVKDIENSNRIDVARRIIKDFAIHFAGDSLGLSVFAENASILLLPTIDTSNLLSRLETVEIGELGDGTAIGASIILALTNLKREPSSSHVILLTDGENNTGKVNLHTIVEILRKKEISLYIVILGSYDHRNVENVDKKKGQKYSGTYYTKTNMEELKTLTNYEKGKYINVLSLEDAKKVYNELKTISRSKQNTFIKTEETPLSFYFTLFSVITIVLSWIIIRLIIGLTND